MNTCRRKLQTLHRWAKFNAVGVLGFCVQVCAVYVFVRAFHIEPLAATALAVETAVLHNFTWHRFVTWKDRPFGKWHDLLLKLLAFNVTNGTVSLVGNLFFVWLIVERRRVSLLVANLLAIAACSSINFVLSDKIVFRIAGNHRSSRGISTNIRRALRLVAPVVCIVAGTAGAHAQDAASPKFTVFAGPGFVRTQGISRGEIQAGASFDEAPPGAWGGFSFEGGYLGPWSKPHIGSAFLSLDYMAAWNFGPSGSGRTAKGTHYWSDRGWKFLPFVSAGYTRLFGTGNAVNFGGGIDYRLSHTRAIRAEIRDYYSFSTPTQHNVALRIGLVIYFSD